MDASLHFRPVVLGTPGLMNEWNIQSRAHACEACGRPFAHQQGYHTLLFDERAGLRRMDVCGACWQSENVAGLRERQGFLSHWQGVHEAPPPPEEAIRKETAESLLRKLIERDDPRDIPAAYILAVMLERKRALKVKEQCVRDGRRVFFYEQPKTGDLFTIVDPDLRLDQLAQVQHDVAQLLEHGLEPPPPPAQEPGAEAALRAREAESPAAPASEPALAPPAAAAEIRT